MEDGISFKTSGSHLQDVECFLSLLSFCLSFLTNLFACMLSYMTWYMMWGCIVKSRLKFTHTVEPGLKLTSSVNFS